jgi:hypothetical protein
MQATLTSYYPGDILFYAKRPGHLNEEVISAWTNSPFVHVAIAISALQKIEALASSVVLTPLDSRAVAASFSYTQHAHPLDPNRLHDALTWLIGQKGNLYGWGDIVNAVLLRFETEVTISVGNHLDCSALGTEFLMRAGGIDLGPLVNPHEVTPAALAKQLGVTIE